MPRPARLDLIVFPLLLLVVCACAPAATALPPASGSSVPSAPRLKVVATTTQVTALAQVVGGDQITLVGMIKANVDPHEYEVTPDDLRTVANAQVIFKNGVGLEKGLEKVFANSGTQAQVVDASQGVQIRKGDEQEPDGDPHIWQSVPNAIIMLHNIRDGLVQADPANAGAYQADAASYEQKLKGLDQYILAQIASIPAADRKLVTNHAALGYYADRYGLTFVGSIIPSMDTSFQPSAKELVDLVNRIKAQHVKAVFTESSVNPALAQQIAQEAGVKVVDGALFGDSLGLPGSGADTLDGMLRSNTDLIVSNLK
jgi:zinc/manganese transport system substrate-binding protein